MILSLIASVAKNRAIGYQNKLLYPFKADLERFKQLTTDHTIIMGRRTFESLPNGALPHRRNIVISRSFASFPGCVRVSSFAEALEQCQNEEEVFIIGGEQVYKEAINRAEKLYLTEIDAMPEHADAFFPDYQEWHRTYYETHKKGEYNPFTFAFTVYQKPILCL